MKTVSKTAIVTVIAAIAMIGAYYGVCARLRYTRDDARNLYIATEKTVRETATKEPDAVLPMFEKMKAEQVWRARFKADWQDGYRLQTGNISSKRVPGWLPSVDKEPKIPVSILSGFVEDVFIRFAGNGFPTPEQQARIKKLIAFADGLMQDLEPSDAKSLRERLLDAHFVVNDFDGAVSILEKGLPGHSENWCKAAIAKIRAHQAEEKKDDAEALKQFIAFGEAMAAEPDKGMPELDPTSGIAYCRAWVLAKNARRCSEYAKKTGKEDDAAAFLAKAKELYQKAIEDTADDQKSLSVLKKEMAEAGL